MRRFAIPMTLVVAALAVLAVLAVLAGSGGTGTGSSSTIVPPRGAVRQCTVIATFDPPLTARVLVPELPVSVSPRSVVRRGWVVAGDRLEVRSRQQCGTQRVLGVSARLRSSVSEPPTDDAAPGAVPDDGSTTAS